MSRRNQLGECAGSAIRRIGSEARRHPRIAAASVGSMVAAVAGGLAAQRKREDLPSLPDAATIASTAAAAVRNAAKASVILAVREHIDPQQELALDAVRQAVAKAGASGVDVTSAAIGGVEGAIEIAGPLGMSRRELATAAAQAARNAAAHVGMVAEQRVGEALAPFLDT